MVRWKFVYVKYFLCWGNNWLKSGRTISLLMWCQGGNIRFSRDFSGKSIKKVFINPVIAEILWLIIVWPPFFW